MKAFQLTQLLQDPQSSLTGEAYMGLVANLPCTLCKRLGQLPMTASEVHHKRSGTGGGKRASDFDTMALCVPHHRDHDGALHVLGVKAFESVYGLTESDLIEDTRSALGITSVMILRWKQQERDRGLATKKRKHDLLLAPIKPAKEKREKPAKPPLRQTALEPSKYSGLANPLSKKKTLPSKPMRAPGAPKAKIPSRPLASASKLGTSSEKSATKKDGAKSASAKIPARGFAKPTGKTAWPSRKIANRPLRSGSTWPSNDKL